MKLDNSLKIYDYLLEQSRDGKTTLSISRELGIPVKEIRENLNAFKSTFVRVGDSEKFTVNRINSADKNTLIKEFEEQKSSSKSNNFLYLILVSIFLSLTTVIIGASGS